MKPEHWLTKKAYSPIRTTDTSVTNPGTGNPLLIPVKNWFDSTNFNEISFNWQVGTDSGSVTDLNLAPHADGTLIIPARNWKEGEILNIKVYQGSSYIDEFNLPIGFVAKTFSSPQGPAPIISENDSEITVSGTNFDIFFSKTTGTITNGSYEGSTIITGGPRLNLGNVTLSDWRLSSISHSTAGNEAVINISGSYGAVEAGFTVKVDGKGLITNQYSIKNPPGDVTEVGIAYDVSPSVDRLSWDRQGLWSAYPSDHIGRTTGVVNRDSGHYAEFGVQPTWSWSGRHARFLPIWIQRSRGTRFQ